MAVPAYSPANNMAARQRVLASAVDMMQQVYTQTVPAPNLGAVVQIPLRNVGLNKRIIVKVEATLTPTAAADQLNLTPWGAANFFSNVQLTDLNNYQRINTTGWHLHALASLRRSAAFAAATLVDGPVGIGSNFPVVSAPAQVVAAKTIRMFFELPLAYNDLDLRGAIMAAAINSTWQLQLTINPSFMVATGADKTLAGYQSATANIGTLTGTVITVYQNYLDQLPYDGGIPVLPLFDLATNYLIQNTTNTAIVANQDFPIPFANFRQFLSTVLIFNNGGVLGTGSDLNYLGVQTANMVFTRKVDPYTSSLGVRDLIKDDFPAGTYVINTRGAPIVTANFGNQQIILNPSVVNANAAVYTGWEMMAQQNQVTMASSLPAS